MNPLQVVVQIENRGKIPVFLKESLLHALPGRFGLVIRIAPFSTKVIAAHTFFARNKSFGRPSTVEVHINGKFIQRLTPQTFVHYPKIIIDGVSDNGKGSIIRVTRPQRQLEISRLSFEMVKGQIPGPGSTAKTKGSLS
ncbi:hypothetical protein KY290_034114 [Solanum tuberosum]|uniref:Uncharacterized protein n=1 Tax=Solanum tuberosum TaxID=4113 RepID=A0ABQ7U2D9_SOLTU|nr:hypothetical protein KY289_033506 [Solanum tuberosum]KAH0741071.1 hypothetical protein KY290_034114 [Solanum tuberosum]